MRKIINGVRYDTESATRIAGADSGGSFSDFRHWDEELYVTPRSKKYFICGSGGPMTRWGKPVGDNTTIGGGGILPISREAALKWCEENDVSEELISHYFNDLIENA